MSNSQFITTASMVELEPEPIPQQWILSGDPQARCKTLSRSRDLTSHIVVWDCTPGQFKWHYAQDEAVVVITGEAFMMLDNGEQKRMGAGDAAFFPAGTVCTWRVTEYFRKVAVLREPLWRPVGFGMKVCNKLLRTAGIAGKAALTLGLAILSLCPGWKTTS